MFSSNPEPSAPRLEEVVGSEGYGCEQGCDVVFLVGDDFQPWRLPAIKGVIQNATPVFRAMFSEHFAPQPQTQDSTSQPQTIRVTDVDGRAFDNLLRFVYGEDVVFQSVETALPTLFASHKYMCPGLVQHCIDYLNQNVSVSNVLQILSTVSLLCGNVQNLENWSRERQMTQGSELLSNPHGGKAGTSSGVDGNLRNKSQPSSRIPQSSSTSSLSSENLDRIETECAALLQTCLKFVDSEATAILSSDEMEDLDYETIRLILFRDTLDIADENLVFTAILKWADKECKRQQKQLTAESKRIVLGELLFLPRYLTMSLQSFEHQGDTCGPAQSGLFTPEEVKCLSTILKKRIKVMTVEDFPSPDSSPSRKPVVLEIPSTLRPYYRTMAKPRSGVEPGSPTKRSRKGWSLIELLKSRRCCCTRMNRRQNQKKRSHRFSSRASSPANSNPSSPLRSALHSRTQSEPQPSKKWNAAVERFVVFLACLFD